MSLSYHGFANFVVSLVCMIETLCPKFVELSTVSGDMPYLSYEIVLVTA